APAASRLYHGDEIPASMACDADAATSRHARCTRLRVPMRMLRRPVASAVLGAIGTRRASTVRLTCALRKSGAINQRIDGGRLELEPLAALDRRRHRNNTVARADQSTDHD